jgi:hypothetical protein
MAVGSARKGLVGKVKKVQKGVCVPQNDISYFGAELAASHYSEGEAVLVYEGRYQRVFRAVVQAHKSPSKARRLGGERLQVHFAHWKKTTDTSVDARFMRKVTGATEKKWDSLVGGGGGESDVLGNEEGDVDEGDFFSGTRPQT